MTPILRWSLRDVNATRQHFTGYMIEPKEAAFPRDTTEGGSIGALTSG
jgi:hypothetical protein